MLRKLRNKDLGFDFKLPLISPGCLIGNYKLKDHISLHHRWNLNLWLSPSVIQLQNPFFWAPPVHQDLSMGQIGLLKTPLSICQSGWKCIPGNLWVHWGPRRGTSVLLHRHYWTGLDYMYICDAGSDIIGKGRVVIKGCNL